MNAKSWRRPQFFNPLYFSLLSLSASSNHNLRKMNLFLQEPPKEAELAVK
jgi:hypothetical protein